MLIQNHIPRENQQTLSRRCQRSKPFLRQDINLYIAVLFQNNVPTKLHTNYYQSLTNIISKVKSK